MCRADNAADPWLRLRLARDWQPTWHARRSEVATHLWGRAYMVPWLETHGRSSLDLGLHSSWTDTGVNTDLPLADRWRQAPHPMHATLQRLREVGQRLLRIAGANPAPVVHDGSAPRAYLEPMLDFSRVGATVRGRF